MGYYRWAPYVPVAKRREQARKKMEKLKKKGSEIQPIEIEGRKIATTFWGKAWCDHIESFSDYENRLPRGRSYVRNGSVCHLEISTGEVKAIVSGSKLYNVSISIDQLPKTRWGNIKKTCAGQIGSLLDLLKGMLSDGVMNVVCDREQGLFPLSSKIKLNCSCPDWATMCKHVAAVLYGVGSRLDNDPAKLFLLRGVNHEELVDLSSAVMDVTQKSAQEKHQHLDDSGLSDIFGIELSDDTNISESNQPPKVKPVTAAKKTKKKIKPKLNAQTTRTTRTKSTKAVTQAAATFPAYLTGISFRKKRQTLVWTQKQLAEKLGVSASSISKWEAKGRKRLQPTAEVLKKIKRVW